MSLQKYKMHVSVAPPTSLTCACATQHSSFGFIKHEYSYHICIMILIVEWFVFNTLHNLCLESVPQILWWRKKKFGFPVPILHSYTPTLFFSYTEHCNLAIVASFSLWCSKTVVFFTLYHCVIYCENADCTGEMVVFSHNMWIYTDMETSLCVNCRPMQRTVNTVFEFTYEACGGALCNSLWLRMLTEKACSSGKHCHGDRDMKKGKCSHTQCPCDDGRQC